MDDLRERFASLDHVPVPDLWPVIERRVEAASPTSLGRPNGVVTRRSFRGERSQSSIRSGLVLLAAALLLAALLGAALMTGSIRFAPAPAPLPSDGILVPVLPQPTRLVGEPGLVAYTMMEADLDDIVGRTPDIELWIAGSDGSGARPIVEGLPPRSRGSRQFRSAAWSHDGGRLAFMYDGRSYVSDAPFENASRLPAVCGGICDEIGDLSWSPDGGRMAITSQIGLRSTLQSVDLADGRRTDLSSIEEPRRIGHPRWSPDGSTLAYVVAELDGATGLRDYSVWLVDVEGGASTQLDVGELPVERVEWSPDGTWLAMGTNAESLFDHETAGQSIIRQRDVYVVRPDGTGLRRLTDEGVAGVPSWIDSGHIRFERNGEDAFRDDVVLEIWSIGIDGGDATHLPVHDALPRFQTERFTWQPTP